MREMSLATVELVDAHGNATLELVITDAEVRLLVKGADLAVRMSGALSIDAARIDLRGRDGVTITSGGDVSLEAAGGLLTTARSHAVVATRGGVQITASDDVILDGERILLNP
jgi:hypothetical protein